MRAGMLLDQASRSVRPRGTRPPRPGLFRVVLRLVLIVSVLLSGLPLTVEWLLAGSVPTPYTPADVVLRSGDHLARFGATGPLRASALLLSALLMGEIALHLALRWQHRRRTLAAAGNSAQRQLYLLRVPSQFKSHTAVHWSDPSSDLFRALAAAMPSRGQRWGRAPYVAWTLVGEPDQATALHYLIAGGRATERARIAATLHATITGQQPQAHVEQVDDPVEAALRVPGQRVVAWQTYHLALPPHYPLRLPQDTDHTDLLGPLVKVLQPRAGEYLTELQIVLQPLRGTRASWLHRGWRGHATALRLRLQEKQDYTLSNDIRSIDRKLAGAPFYATLRVLVVVDRVTTAQAALERITAGLGAYEARTSHLVQQWVPNGMEYVEIQA